MALLGIPLCIFAVLFAAAWLFDSTISCHSISTEDAKSFSEESFAKIRIGMTADEVNKILGTPLDVSRISTNAQEWHYTRSKEPIDGWGTWDMRYFVVSNGMVSEITKAKNMNH